MLLIYHVALYPDREESNKARQRACCTCGPLPIRLPHSGQTKKTRVEVLHFVQSEPHLFRSRMWPLSATLPGVVLWTNTLPSRSPRTASPGSKIPPRVRPSLSPRLTEDLTNLSLKIRLEIKNDVIHPRWGSPYAILAPFNAQSLAMFSSRAIVAQYPTPKFQTS